MKILMISLDKKIFEENSDVRKRLANYGSLVNSLHIIVFTLTEQGFQDIKIAKNVYVYPTNSKRKIQYIRDAVKIGDKISNFKLITTQEAFTGLSGWWLSRKYGVKFQMAVHTDIFSPYFSKGIKNKIELFLFKFLLPKADGIRVVSERIRVSLLKRFKILTADIQVLPLFVDVEKFKDKEVLSEKFDLHKKYPQFEFVVLMASRLSKEKNIGMVISVMGEVVKKYPEIGLIIVGEGGEYKELRNSVGTLGLNHNVIFEPWTNNLSSYYKTTDLFVLSSNFEGYCMTLVETAVSGCPILTTDVGVVGELIDSNNALVCPVGDSLCFARNIVMLYENKAIRARLKEDVVKVFGKIIIRKKEQYLSEIKKGWFSLVNRKKNRPLLD